MEFLGALTGSVVPFLIILTILVFVHELGHYWVARRCGVRVEVFSIGFGPELFGWNDRAGTRWKLSAIPLGGYVRMLGDADAASATMADASGYSAQERAEAFPYKPLGQRTAIVAAGPIANFLFAVVLFAALFAFVGQRHAAPSVDVVLAGSAAESAGLQPGDVILEIDGENIDRFDDLQRIVTTSPGVPLDLVVLRDASQTTLTVTPESVEHTDPFGNTTTIGRLGVQSEQVEWVRLDPFSAVTTASVETVRIAGLTLEAVWQMIAGSRTTEELGGPIRIAQMSGQVAETGIVATMWFMAVLSINLGLINLFPIPVLDGGHLVFYAAEAVRGRPVGEKVREYASMAGLTLVITLMVFVTWNDIVSLPFFQRLGSLFG